jgi:hypothetical protein
VHCGYVCKRPGYLHCAVHAGSCVVDSYVGSVLHQLWHGLLCVQRE